MIKQKRTNLHRHEFEKLITDANCNHIKDVVDILFYRENSYIRDHQLVVKNRYNDAQDQTILGRINMLWVIPIYCITIMPVRFILYGDGGVSEDTKFGKFLMGLLGGKLV